MVIILKKENFHPFKGEILATFLPVSRGKNAHPLVTDIITMATSIAFVVIFICFVFHKAWLYHSIASETFLLNLINSLRTVPFIAPVSLL